MHAETCRRLRDIIERNEWHQPGAEPTWSTIMPLRFDFANRAEQIRAYAFESALTGLSTSDPLIAIRCYGQLCQYLGELRSEGPGPLLCDASLELRNRLESMLSASRDVLVPLLRTGEL